MTKASSQNKPVDKPRQDVVAGDTSEDVKKFAKAAKTFTGKATETRRSAQKTLIALGISTQTGKLTKRYR